MKKGAIFILSFLIGIMLSYSALAISTDIKPNYESSETMIIGFNGIILEPILKGNVELKREHISMPFEYDVKKIGDRYYLWGVVPSEKGNYTLHVKSIATTQEGATVSLDYNYTFSVGENKSKYYVKPGLISSERDFEVSIFSNLDDYQTIETNFLGERAVVLNPGENKIRFSIDSLNESVITNITIGDYILPAYIFINTSLKKNIFFGNESEIGVENITRNLSEIEKEAFENRENPDDYSAYYCYEIPGTRCTAEEECSGKFLLTKDGSCCVNGSCQLPGTSYAWAGYLLAGIVILGGVFVWFKYKKTKLARNPLDKKIQEAEKKL